MSKKKTELETLESLKKYYKDVFPTTVEEALNTLIKEEIEKQKELIEKIRKSIPNTSKIPYEKVASLVKAKTNL